MSDIGRWSKIAMLTAALAVSAPAARAQAGVSNLRGERVDLHAVRDQIGIVTAAADRTAWIRVPHRCAAGQTVDFLFYSDGGDTMATGQIAWASPVAPYEAYVTGVRAVSTRHPVDPYDSIDAFEVPSKRTRDYGVRPQNDGTGVSLARGVFVRTSIAPSASGSESVEPVRAHIAALKALKPVNRTALAIANAASRALLPAVEIEGRPDEIDVDYMALSINLERSADTG